MLLRNTTTYRSSVVSYYKAIVRFGLKLKVTEWIPVQSSICIFFSEFTKMISLSKRWSLYIHRHWLIVQSDIIIVYIYNWTRQWTLEREYRYCKNEVMLRQLQVESFSHIDGLTDFEIFIFLLFCFSLLLFYLLRNLFTRRCVISKCIIPLHIV